MSDTADSEGPAVILIVEDQLLLALDLATALEDAGYRVLELATRHYPALKIAIAAKPDLALVNIGLEAGDDGVALARDLGRLGIPVMFISGQTDKAELACDLCVASLSKPYSSKDMVEAVDYLFRHRRGEQSRPAPPRLRVFDHPVSCL